MVQVKTCCLKAPSHYQCWPIINEAHWHLDESNFTWITIDIMYHSIWSIWKLHNWKYLGNGQKFTSFPISEFQQRHNLCWTTHFHDTVTLTFVTHDVFSTHTELLWGWLFLHNGLLWRASALWPLNFDWHPSSALGWLYLQQVPVSIALSMQWLHYIHQKNKCSYCMSIETVFRKVEAYFFRDCYRYRYMFFAC